MLCGCGRGGNGGGLACVGVACSAVSSFALLPIKVAPGSARGGKIGMTGGSSGGLRGLVEKEDWLALEGCRESFFIAFARDCDPDLARCESDIWRLGASPSHERGGESGPAATLEVPALVPLSRSRGGASRASADCVIDGAASGPIGLAFGSGCPLPVALPAG
jgi:hypothetical protein